MPVPVTRLEELRASTFLTPCRGEDLTALAAAMEEVTFARDHLLYEQGASGDAMHLILSGQVGVLRAVDRDLPAAVKTRPRDRILAVVGAGECVGEMALIDGEPRSATVVAVDEVVTAQLTRAGYDRLRAADVRCGIRVTLGLFRLISRRIRQVDKSLEQVNHRMYTI